MLDYVRQNPVELGVLPYLTPREKESLMDDLIKRGIADWLEAESE
jgi:hypothetical protein